MKRHKKRLRVLKWKGDTPAVDYPVKVPNGPCDFSYQPSHSTYWFSSMKKYNSWSDKHSLLDICPKTGLLMSMCNDKFWNDTDEEEISKRYGYNARITSGWVFEPEPVQAAYQKYIVDKAAEKAIFG